MFDSMSDNAKGAILMMAAMASFACSDATIKMLIEFLPFDQVLFLRGVITMALVVTVLARISGPVRLQMSRADWGWTALRSACEVGASITILRALILMPLGNVTAILQASSFVIAILGAVFLRETLGWRRLLAITIGFIGVLFIVKPGTDGFNAAAIWALFGMLFVSVRDLSVRKLTEEASTTTITLAAIVAVTAYAGLSLAISQDFVAVGRAEWQLLALSGVLILAAYAFSIAAMRVGEISVVTPFRYTALIWASVLGFLVFGDWPDGYSMLGIAIIATTGVYTVLREAKRRKEMGEA